MGVCDVYLPFQYRLVSTSVLFKKIRKWRGREGGYTRKERPDLRVDIRLTKTLHIES